MPVGMGRFTLICQRFHYLKGGRSVKVKAFAVIPHPGEIEIKPLVLCKECRWWNGIVCENGIIRVQRDGNWFCAGGEKGEEDGKAD